LEYGIKFLVLPDVITTQQNNEEAGLYTFTFYFLYPYMGTGGTRQ
jgi:hypothetical protein